MPSVHRQYKDAIYAQFARVGKAVAAPKRLELLDILCQGPRTVEALAKQAGLSVANTSQHLKTLKSGRLVEAEKKGLYVEYRLGDNVCDFYLALRRLAETRLAEVEAVTRTYLEDRDELEPIHSDELVRRARAGEVTVLDVRPAEEYQAGHIAGALSIPVTELEARIKELPANREIVAYCRGPYCVMAVEAVEFLRSKGFGAHRMEQGVLEWRNRGLPIESDTQEATP